MTEELDRYQRDHRSFFMEAWLPTALGERWQAYQHLPLNVLRDLHPQIWRFGPNAETLPAAFATLAAAIRAELSSSQHLPGQITPVLHPLFTITADFNPLWREDPYISSRDTDLAHRTNEVTEPALDRHLPGYTELMRLQPFRNWGYDQTTEQEWIAPHLDMVQTYVYLHLSRDLLTKSRGAKQPLRAYHRLNKSLGISA